MLILVPDITVKSVYDNHAHSGKLLFSSNKR